MRVVRLATLLAGIGFLVAACGRVPFASSPTEAPSASSQQSPAAADGTLAIAAPSLHGAEVGLAYTPVTLQTTGGDGPFMWRISDGALPGGMDLSLDGLIAGTPTAAGTFNFTVEVMDAGFTTADIVGSINVVARLAVYLVGEAATNGSVAVCTEPGSARCPSTPDNRYAPFAAVGGGAAPYSYAVVSGDLPPGTRLNGLALAGTFPPDVRWTYTFTVSVTDSMGVSATITVEYILWHRMNLPPSP